MHSLIIHLPDSSARRSNVDRLMQVLPDPLVMAAVDGRDPARIRDIEIRAGDHLHPPYPFALLPGEVGCFLSHRKCWQWIVDNDVDHALIVEDDLVPDAALWPDALDLARHHIKPDGYIRLPAKQREIAARTLGGQGASTLMLPKVIGLQTVAQVVGRSAAERLLAMSGIMDRPVDSFLQMHWATGQPVHTILPSGVTELSGDGSTIQKKPRINGKLMREIRRTVYRARIRASPQSR